MDLRRLQADIEALQTRIIAYKMLGINHPRLEARLALLRLFESGEGKDCAFYAVMSGFTEARVYSYVKRYDVALAPKIRKQRGERKKYTISPAIAKKRAEKREMFADLLRQGKNQSEIARILGVSRQYVSEYIKYHGIRV